MLVNNAGTAVLGPLGGADSDRVETRIQVNVMAVIRLAAAALAAFIPRRQGTVVNIASVVALAPELFSGAYSASKRKRLNFGPVELIAETDVGHAGHDRLDPALRMPVGHQSGAARRFHSDDVRAGLGGMADQNGKTH